MGNIGAFEPHEAFLGAPVAERVDAPIPDDSSIDHVAVFSFGLPPFPVFRQSGR